MKIVAESQALKDILAQIDRIASTIKIVRSGPGEANIGQWQRNHLLISGETGVGKEIFGLYLAEEIIGPGFSEDDHVVIENCATLNNELADSLLFGHEAGAFTGAVKRSRGLIEAANGKILILDEIDKLSPSLQAKLLRFLETGKYKRLGGCDSILRSKCVVIAMGVNVSNIMQDLYYRFTHRIDIPPLRERVEDIVPLFEQFVDHRGEFQVGTDIAILLKQYPWPGNVRELRNICDRLSVRDQMNRKAVLQLLSEQKRGRSVNESPFDGMTLDEIERQALVSALRKFRFVQQDAAAALGISPRAMSYKVRQFKIVKEIGGVSVSTQ